MLTITINYESAWRNSFLTGSNNEPNKPNSRKFIGSMTALRKDENRLSRSITKDTVMGVLNRLIGDRRKLYQSRLDENYYFKHLESVLTEEHIVDKPIISDEVIFLRNLVSKDKDGFTGLIKATHPAFSSSFSNSLWSILFYPLDDVLAFIITGKEIKPKMPKSLDPLDVAFRAEEIGALKGEDVSEQWQAAIDRLSEAFPDVDYRLAANNKFRPAAFYFSAIYLKLAALQDAGVDVSCVLSRSGLIRGISKRSFTHADFMMPFVTGERKMTIGGPYMSIDRFKDGNAGVVKNLLKTATGTLTLNLPLNNLESTELIYLIQSAGVGTFRLGKKGLAYVSSLTYTPPASPFVAPIVPAAL